jgi:hypothetical protein
MGWLLSSGNQMIWIRPTFQSIQEKYNAAAQKGGMMDQAIAATIWGDEQGPVDVKSWFSVAYDPNNAYWVARQNPAVCQQFMHARTGSAEKKDQDLLLNSAGVRDGPALALLNYKWTLELTAKLSGNAYRWSVVNSSGTFKHWASRTRFVRQLDASMMTPDERLCEMTQMAVSDPNFSKEMKAQFGVLGDPTFLLTMAAVFGIFVGVGATAYVIGGAAFAAAVSRLLGVTMIVSQVKVYVDLFNELKRCCFSDKQSDFTTGSKTIQKILYQAVQDIAVLVTMEAAVKCISKAAEVLKTLFLRHAPMKWVEAANAGLPKLQAKITELHTRMYGYAEDRLLKHVPDPRAIFRKGEVDYYLRRSAKKREMIVIREPSEDRMEWLHKLYGWAQGKAQFIKAKSSTGWHGLLCVARNGEVAEALAHSAPQPYPMGNLRGVFPEIDAVIAKCPSCPSYELPIGKNCTDENGGCFDWGTKENPNLRNMRDAKGYRVVDLGHADPKLKGKLLVVDALGNPVVQDTDIASIKKGREAAGTHLEPGKDTAHPEDNFRAEDEMNVEIEQDEESGVYRSVQHSGGGGAEAHRREQHARGEKHWNPWDAKKGVYKKEALYVFLPMKRGGWSSNLFKFEGWAEFVEFCTKNQIHMQDFTTPTQYTH